MARTKKTPFAPWQSCKDDGIEKRYIRLGNSLLLHPAVMELSDKAFRIYVHMLLEAEGKRTFVFPRQTYKRLAGNTTFQRAKNELIEKGFIREKQCNRNLRKPNEYEFLEDWKQHIHPP